MYVFKDKMSVVFNPSKVKVERVHNSMFSKGKHEILQSNEKYSFEKYENIFQTSLNDGSYVVHNGFVNTCCQAYNRHHKLVIRPEDVWLAIQTQFAFYVNARSEELRTRFVNHSSKQKLEIRASDFGTNNIGKLSTKMVEKMKSYLKDENLQKWVLPSFTTTTNDDIIVFSMTMMGTLKEYFSYGFQLMCGLPQVTLLGTSDDWKDIRSRADYLLKFENKQGNMALWHKKLIPVLEKFVETSQGKPDLEWWNSICAIQGGGSGPRYLEGWITAFTVFKDDGEWVGTSRIDTSNIASTCVHFEMEIDIAGGVKRKATGFVGHLCTEVKNKDTLIPKMDWAICFNKDKSDSKE